MGVEKKLVGSPFALLMSATASSSLGSAIVAFAVPVVYLRMSGSLGAMASVATVEGVVAAVAMLLIGPLVDGHDRVVLMRLSEAEETLNDAFLVALVACHVTVPAPWIALAALSAAFSSLSSMSGNAAMRAIIDPSGMFLAVSVAQGVQYATMLLGPAVGGVLLQFAPSWAPFLCGVVGEGVALAVLLVVRRVPRRVAAEGAAGPGTVGAALRRFAVDALAGVRLIGVRPVYRATAWYLLVLSFGSGLLMPALVYGFTLDGAPPTLISSLSVASGVGGLVGALVVNPVVDRLDLPLGRTIIGVGVLVAVLVGVAGGIGRWQAYLVMALAIAMLSPLLVGGLKSFLMASTSDAMQGRLFAALNVSIAVASALAPALAALLLARVGLAGAMAAGALLLAASALTVVAVPALRRIPAPDGWDAYLAGPAPDDRRA